MKKKEFVLDAESESRIAAERKRHGASRSEIVRRAIKKALPDGKISTKQAESDK